MHTMENGQADTGPEDFDSLAEFLVDNPEADTSEELKQKPEGSDEDNPEGQTKDATADDEGDESDSEQAEKQPSDLKFKVPVKGEDGAETTVEVDQKELIAGYQRHADYTRKTMELGNRERDITQKMATSFEENRSHYMQQAQLAHAAVRQIAGLRNPEQMAQLAQTDPAQWVQEQQRVAAINGVMSQIEQGMQIEQGRAQQATIEAQKKSWEHAWNVLGEAKIDKPMLQSMFAKAAKSYGIPAEQFNNLYDPKVVLMLRDAVAYQDLKEKKAAVTKKVNESPRLPAQRQSVPQNEQRTTAINKRFASGKAKLGDLAAYLDR
jgi:hypothetical protein